MTKLTNAEHAKLTRKCVCCGTYLPICKKGFYCQSCGKAIEFERWREAKQRKTAPSDLYA